MATTPPIKKLEVWVLTHEFEYSYDTDPIISLNPNRTEGLAKLNCMLSERSEEGYEKIIDNEDEISYGNGDMFISLVRNYIDSNVSKETKVIKHCFGITNFSLPNEILMEINKYIPVWVLIGQGHGYGDNDVIVSLHRHKEDAIEEQLIKVQISEDSYEKEETEDRITYHNEDRDCCHITIVKHYVK